MMSLSFVACLFAQTVMQSPTCREHQLTFTATPTPFGCLLYGQTEIAKWDREHPNHRRKPGYRCGPAGRYARA